MDSTILYPALHTETPLPAPPISDAVTEKVTENVTENTELLKEPIDCEPMEAVTCDWSEILKIWMSNSQIVTAQPAIPANGQTVIDWSVIKDWTPQENASIVDNMKNLTEIYLNLRSQILANSEGMTRIELLGVLDTMFQSCLDKLYEETTPLVSFFSENGQEEAAKKIKPSLAHAAYTTINRSAVKRTSRYGEFPEGLGSASQSRQAPKQSAVTKTVQTDLAFPKAATAPSAKPQAKPAEAPPPLKQEQVRGKSAALLQNAEKKTVSLDSKQAAPRPYPDANGEHALNAASKSTAPSLSAQDFSGGFSLHDLQKGVQFARHITPVNLSSAPADAVETTAAKQENLNLNIGLMYVKTEVFSEYSGVGSGMLQAVRAAVDRFIFHYLTSNSQSASLPAGKQEIAANVERALLAGRKMLDAFQKTKDLRLALSKLEEKTLSFSERKELQMEEAAAYSNMKANARRLGESQIFENWNTFTRAFALYEAFGIKNLWNLFGSGILDIFARPALSSSISDIMYGFKLVWAAVSLLLLIGAMAQYGVPTPHAAVTSLNFAVSLAIVRYL